jgi:hypothetical protein
MRSFVSRAAPFPEDAQSTDVLEIIRTWYSERTTIRRPRAVLAPVSSRAMADTCLKHHFLLAMPRKAPTISATHHLHL